MTTSYDKVSTQQVDAFVKGLKENSKAGATFDSAVALDFVESNVKGKTETAIPEDLSKTLDSITGDGAEKLAGKRMVIQSILDSCASYEKAHGCPAPADVIEQALHNAFSTTPDGRKLDSAAQADSNHSENLSLQPNRAVVAIVSAVTEAIPFAHYLPTDIGSGQAKLAILTHRAGTDTGAYATDGIMDGIESGDPYISSARVHSMYPDAQGKIECKITAKMTARDKCDQDADGVKLLRNRTLVYVNGFPCVLEHSNTSTGASPLSGTAVVSGVAYAITGTVNPDTGAVSLTSTPALPQSVRVKIEAFIDFERAPELTPDVLAHVETFDLFANPWRTKTRQSIDARNQMANELNLDPQSECMVAIQNQFANERYYDVLAKGLDLAQNDTETFDYGKARQYQDQTRAAVWKDLAYPLGALSQRMAENTMNHGITHLFVGKRIAAQMRGMTNEVFQSSGISERPGIYRVGRLFGTYEVYYTPKIIKETESTAQILCVGRATNVAQNPVVLGDAVAPVMIPLYANNDFKAGAGYYAKNFTCVNPHEPSARGFALLNVTNMD